MTTAPLATARLQLHGGFTLVDAAVRVSYYAGLGVSHLYLSPVTRARQGSTHGYDVVDHAVVSPELGGEEALRRLSHEARHHGMGLVIDIVPNHMAAHPENSWWWSVLKHGLSSTYAHWFDIDWNCSFGGLQGKVLAPFLSGSVRRNLMRGEIKLEFSGEAAVLRVGNVIYPVVLNTEFGEGMTHAQVVSFYDPGTPAGRSRLDELLRRQHFRLADWRCAGKCINWRRFFDIGDLIALRVEQAEVFDAVHRLPLRLFAQGIIDGVRVDHVDGLAQPLGYCRRLRDALAAGATQRPEDRRHDCPWLVVEKILGQDEVLDERWAVDGTTGYDFMNQVAAVMHSPLGETPLSEHWRSLSPADPSVDRTLSRIRHTLLRRSFAAESRALLLTLHDLCQAGLGVSSVDDRFLRRGLERVIRLFPVYRTYVENLVAAPGDAALLAYVCQRALQDLEQEACDCSSAHECGSHGQAGAGDIQQAVVEAITGWLAGDGPAPSGGSDARWEELKRDLIRGFQQLTPPLAAKSIEDTLLYRYGRLLSRNEVGSDPRQFSMSIDDFHRRNAWRARHAQRTLLATATHDQKRGEDVRARLAVLSQIPERWIVFSRQWLDASRGRYPSDEMAGNQAERYMLLQTLVGTWPLDLSLADGDGLQRYAQRIMEWQTKALREAKQSSSWVRPDTRREEGMNRFIHEILVGRQSGSRRDIFQFVQEIAPAGVVNSLAQCVLRLTSPGVPDLYQGTEYWDFSLVDPDNRRAVDYEGRQTSLGRLKTNVDINALLSNWRSGSIKQYVIWRCLALRMKERQIFQDGNYLVLKVEGAAESQVVAYLREFRGSCVLVVTPILCASGVPMLDGPGPIIAADYWKETKIVLPRTCFSTEWFNIFTGFRYFAGPDGSLSLADLLAGFSVAVLVGHPVN